MPLEEDLRPARVLAEDEIRLAELAHHAQGDVLEIPDRRRADRERHYSQDLEPDEPGSDEPGVRSKQSRHDPHEVASGLKSLDTHRLQQQARGTGREPG